MAPSTAPPPVVRWPVYTVSLVHTWRGMATCCTMGVAESTRACSCALASVAVAAKTVKAMAFFMGFSRETGPTP